MLRIVGMSIRPATAADLSYIVSLSKKHATELGFLPTLAMANYLERDRVRMATENGEPCGYFLTGGFGVQRLRIFQACVQMDARGLDHGISLLSSTINSALITGTHHITLHCRDGLESNGFWSACGFKSEGLLFGGKARRKLIHQWRLDIADAISNPVLPYASRLLASLRSGSSKNALSSACETLSRSPEKTPTLDPRETNTKQRGGWYELARSFATEAFPPHAPTHAFP